MDGSARMLGRLGGGLGDMKGRGRALRRAGVAAALGGALLMAGCGTSSSSVAPSSASGSARAPAPGDTAGTAQRQHGSPRWEATASLSGTGDMAASAPFGIVPDVLQWRVHWHCESGQLTITTDPTSPSGKPLVEGRCPGNGDAYATRPGQIRLGIQTAGPWTAVVDQEVDTPLDEPPLPEMASAQVLARGSFRDVDRTGKGQTILFRLGDGRLALRLEGFEIPINTDLYVWTEPVAGLPNSAAMYDATHVVVAALKSTSGSQNYIVPPTTPPDQIKSIVIWCQIQQFAYVASDLKLGA